MKDTYLSEYITEKEVSEEFLNYYRSSESYKYANQLMSYKGFHAYLNEKDEAEVQVPREYYEFLEKMEIMNPDAITIPDYISFLENYLDHKSKSSTDAREDGAAPETIIKFNIAKKYLSDSPLMIC